MWPDYHSGGIAETKVIRKDLQSQFSVSIMLYWNKPGRKESKCVPSQIQNQSSETLSERPARNMNHGEFHKLFNIFCFHLSPRLIEIGERKTFRFSFFRWWWRNSANCSSCFEKLMNISGIFFLFRQNKSHISIH